MASGISRCGTTRTDPNRDKLPGYLVVMPGNENFERLKSEAPAGGSFQLRTAQVDVGCLVEASRRGFLIEARDLKNAALTRLAEWDSLGIDGLEGLELLAVQRSEYPSDKGTIGGFYIA
jgi:hypothetical protein